MWYKNTNINPVCASPPSALYINFWLDWQAGFIVWSDYLDRVCRKKSGFNCWSPFLAWLNWFEHWVQKSFLSWVSCWEIGCSQKSVSLTEMSHFVHHSAFYLAWIYIFFYILHFNAVSYMYYKNKYIQDLNVILNIYQIYQMGLITQHF